IRADLPATVDPPPAFQVTANTPVRGTLGVLTTPVTATLNHAVAIATLTASTFVLRDSGSAPVSASVSYNASSRTATLTPTSALAPLSDYAATVVSGSNGVKDTAGAPLAARISWTFRTAAGATTSLPAATFAFSEGAG